MRKLVAILMATGSIVACSGSSSSDSNPITIEQVPSELATSVCAAEQACAPFYYHIGFANTDCVTKLTKQFQEASYTDIQNAVTAGTVKFDGNQARACVTAVSSGSCAVLDNNLPDACQKTFAGTVATGGDCDIDEECSGLSRCEVTGSTCPGKCAPRASAGIACTQDGDCALGLVCSTITSLCVTPAAAGGDCGGTVAGDCAAGLICQGADDDTKKAGTCMTAAMALAGAAGADCALAGPWCADGLSCVVQSLSDDKKTLISKCQPLAAAGGMCGFGVPSQCPSGQYCPVGVLQLVAGTFSASCTALPTSGQACAPQAFGDRCAANLVCDDVTAPLKPVCIAPHELGEPCADSGLCYSQNCVGGACVPASPCAK